jgi:diketogulonate reductase-like aldo/keto reductase
VQRVQHPNDGFHLVWPGQVSSASYRRVSVAGRLTIKDTLNSWIELNGDCVNQVDPLLTHPVVSKVAEAHKRSTAQVLLRWATQRGFIVIPKSTKPERIAENLDSTDFDLTEEEIKAISGLNKNFRMGNPIAFDPRLAIFA